MDLAKLQADPCEFRRSLVIDAGAGLRRLGGCVESWQESDFRALDPMLMGVVERVGGGRAWLERPRGHSKTTDLAVMVSWLLFASRRTVRGVAAAADQDQARLVRDAMLDLCRANPWLGRILEVQKDRVANRHTGSELEIITSDAATSYGLLVDFIVCDELVHWRGRELWDSLLSSAAKKAACLLAVITNAGFIDSWQWEVREAVRRGWYFSRLEGPKASWISAERLAEQRRLLPEIAYRRLWLNQWSDGSGDAIRSEDLEAAVTLRGPSRRARLGWAYVAGVDLGLKRDASAVVVVGKHVGYSESAAVEPELSRWQRVLIDAGLIERPEAEYEWEGCEGTGRLRVARVELWRPEGGKVDLGVVERALLDLHRRFSPVVAFDPWQAEYLAQRLADAGVPTVPVPFVPGNLASMAQETIGALVERRIELYPHGQLLEDLRRLRVVEKGYGVRLQSPRGPAGHGDAATALAIALHAARGIESGVELEGELVCWP